MKKKIGFDNEKYLEEQSKYILERVKQWKKLYIEFGGKLMNDLHAKRVLPGYDENAKIKLLQKIKDKIEVIICIYSGDVDKHKLQGDFKEPYEMQTFKLIDSFHEFGIQINSVVITRHDGNQNAEKFKQKLESNNIKVYFHYPVKGYPMDVDTIVSDEGYGKNEYIETKKPIVVVTAPGAGSGKLATCLNQLYHEYKRGNLACYSKFETFPVWNYPLKHPINVAYEAATVEIKDVTMIDPFHLQAYNQIAINYNRDVEAFPLLKKILEKISGKDSLYKSPTDMGVNRIGFAITNEEVVTKASKEEVIIRYFRAACDLKKSNIDKETFQRTLILLQSLNLQPEDRIVAKIAHEKLKEVIKNKKYVNFVHSVVALEIGEDQYTYGKRSVLMTAPSAAILNAIKKLSGIADEINLISLVILEPILKLKSNLLESKNEPLSCEEILIALSISAVTNPTAEYAMKKLSLLRGMQAHSTYMINKNDEQTYRKLGIVLTCDPVFPTENLYDN